MKKRYTPEDMQNEAEFELLTVVSHQNLRDFVLEQIRKEKYIIRIYSVYQVFMMILFAFFLTRSIVLFVRGFHEPFTGIGIAILFSFSILIVVHELLHALAYFLSGARKISFGLILKKFVFYALADRQVIASRAFHFVALTPFVAVKLVCLLAILQFPGDRLLYFFLSVMCLHSLFCAGDIAMLAFYNLHRGKEIYNYDNRAEGKTYFYIRKNIKI